jgi:hypothetical protein
MIEAIRFMVVFAAVGAIAFPIYYSTFAWRSTAPGRSAMLLAVALGTVLGLAAISVFGVRLPRWLVLAAYSFLAGGVWWQLGTLHRARRRYRSVSDERQEVG